MLRVEPLTGHTERGRGGRERARDAAVQEKAGAQREEGEGGALDEAMQEKAGHQVDVCQERMCRREGLGKGECLC